MKKALVVPAKGIGDALLMMIASHHLLQSGFFVTTCHPALRELQVWFPGQQFVSHLPDDLSSFDLIIIENDNSPKMHDWKLKFPQACIFYPSYHPKKNPPLTSQDRVFKEDLSMAENIALAIEAPSNSNGIRPPADLVHRRFERRIIIHPTSSTEEKNWPPKRFLQLSAALQKRGYETLFAYGPSELFPTLHELAGAIYESGYVIGNDSVIGHLGSNLNIPTLIIANDEKRMRLWRPGWLKGDVITPYSWIPRKIRQKYWKQLISSRRVISTFQRLVQDHTPPFLR